MIGGSIKSFFILLSSIKISMSFDKCSVESLFAID
jgi:hypothetical protein